MNILVGDKLRNNSFQMITDDKMLNGQFVSCYSDFHISDFAERRSFLVGLIMSRIRVGPVKND